MHPVRSQTASPTNVSRPKAAANPREAPIHQTIAVDRLLDNRHLGDAQVRDQGTVSRIRCTNIGRSARIAACEGVVTEIAAQARGDQDGGSGSVSEHVSQERGG